MAEVTHCFELLLGNKIPAPLPPTVVAYGDDAFLRKETLSRVLALAGIDPETLRHFDGDDCKWIDVHDELATMSLFDPDARRIAMVSAADFLIKESRPQLEKWFAKPAPGSLLLLQVVTFPSNTILFKLAAEHGLCITCS